MCKLFVLHVLSACYMNVLPNYAIEYNLTLTSGPDRYDGTTLPLLVELCDYTGKCISDTFTDYGEFKGSVDVSIRGTLSTIDHARISTVIPSYDYETHNDIYVLNKFEVKSPQYYVVYVYVIVRDDIHQEVELRTCRSYESYMDYFYGKSRYDCKPCNCPNKAKCDQHNGNCVMCAAGFKGKACGTQCDNGTFGSDCTSNCSQNCNNVCDKRVGNCTCLNGFMSSKCHQRCARGRYGFYCQDKCDKCINGCNHVNGSCIGGCVTGYVGPKCDPCRNSTYGVNCSHSCNCFNHYACNYTTGDCGRYGCALRWTGDLKCSVRLQCDKHKWGKNCIDCGACLTNCSAQMHSCQHRCDSDTGVCVGHSCLPFFVGSRCDVCDNKMYGRMCYNLCGKCEMNCGTVTGHCFQDKCERGYLGSKCDMTCVTGNFGWSCLQKCPTRCRTGLCSFVDGSCIDGCEDGWGGKFCSEYATCNDRHFYGPNCDTPCHNCYAGVCTSNGTCIHGCTLGYWSVGCRKACISGKYGRNCERFCGRCAEWEDCDMITGTCPHRCMGHFENKMCAFCPSDYFGPECNKRCGHCKDGKSCDTHSGVCRNGCAIGFHGHYCEIRDHILAELDPSL